MQVETHASHHTDITDKLAGASLRHLRETFPALHLVRTAKIVRLVGKLTFAVLVCSLIAMFFAPWQQTSRGYGTVLAIDPQYRPQNVESQYDGIIEYIKPGLREGSSVEEGELLVRLEPFAVQELDQLRQQIAQTELALLAQKNAVQFAEQNVQFQLESGRRMLEGAQSDVKAAQDKLEQTKQQVVSDEADVKQKEYDRDLAEELFPKGLASEQSLMDKRNGLDAAKAKLEKARRTVDESKNLLEAKQSEFIAKQNDVDIKNRESQTKEQQEKGKLTEIENKLTELKIKESVFDRLEIRAPRSGVVFKVFSREGANTVKKGDLLFMLVPKTEDLGVELTVPGRDMPLVHVGDKVRLQFQGWPAVQFVGWPSAAVGTFGGQVLALSPTDDMKGDFSVLIEPDPKEPAWPDDRYLRQGVRANGWVLLNQVSLGYEIWRQLNGFPPVISDQEPSKAGFGQEKTKIKLPK
ncbi:MAG: HlyD family efflux transporter periplasmic adaptor subunit [Pirellulaceae bacterium]|nr:HlyD family efflux transporter periplasmic adaptor subunit [Pirellulaceae bacterium]